MRLMTMLLVLVGAVALSLTLYVLSGGHMILLVLPLVFAAPLFRRRRRR